MQSEDTETTSSSHATSSSQILSSPAPPNQLLSTILRHDTKQTSYKIALLRSINDVVLSFPDLTPSSAQAPHTDHGAGTDARPIAVPLRVLAGFWVGYYWPFVAPGHPVLQGARATRAGEQRNDLSFRPALTKLRQEWENLCGGGIELCGEGIEPGCGAIDLNAGAPDGFLLSGEMRLPRKRAQYPEALVDAYDDAIKAISSALLQPIQYAGPGQWQIFARPQRLDLLGESVVPIPGARPEDRCLVIDRALWETFITLSLWVEALAIHEWCLFTEQVDPAQTRGAIYQMLTSRPESRRPLTWERNAVNLLLLEGHAFTCPWSHKRIQGAGARYDLDHIVPLSIYPINELWNLVPSDAYTNSHLKRARLPSPERMARAQEPLTSIYTTYRLSGGLSEALQADALARFGKPRGLFDPGELASQAARFVRYLGDTRNLAVF